MPELRTLLRTQRFMFALLLSLSLLAANVIAETSFAKPANWPAELATFVPLAIMAMASTPAILSAPGGIDISLGPLAVFCNCFLVVVLMAHGIDSAWLCIPILLGLGAAVGAINGLLVAVFRYQSVIATVCTFFVLTGVNLKVASSQYSAPAHNWTQHLAGKVGPVPGALILLLAPALIWLVLTRTSFVRALYAVGGNDATAFSAGVNVSATRVIAYASGGLFAAVAGIALTALVQSSQGGASSQYTLVALAAVALGGTSFAGGRGGMWGAVLGAGCLYLIQTLLSALSVPPTWLQVVYGAMLLMGVVIGAQVSMQRPVEAATA
jgi:ribose transport system permease protein